MEDILIIDAVERFLKGEMSAEEKHFFLELRKNNAEIDQLVVEHTIFLHQMEAFGDRKDFKHQLNEVHNNLLEKGDISTTEKEKGKVVTMWNKYKRIASIAATIAGVTALVMSGLVTYFSPGPAKKELRDLARVVQQINHKVNAQGNKISEISETEESKVPVDERPLNAGTSFLIDSKGYLVTNAHVVTGSSTILVQNNKGQEFKAKIAHLDAEKDLAILKIEDIDFKPLGSLPYSIRKSNTDLGEEIFTLGFPRDEIVYNEGYLSAKTGYNGDTISCQIAVSANPGNSGGPVLNKNGEVVGILSTAQQNAEGVVFAIKSKNIYSALTDLKKDTTYQRIKLPTTSSIKNLERVQQIKQIQDCVFMVRGFRK